MDVEAFLARVRALARDAQKTIDELSLPRTRFAVNVHQYRRRTYEAFVRRHYTDDVPRIGALSMNPGRNGAVQTGIPFTDMALARQVLPSFDRIRERPPAHVPPGSNELSGRRILKWAQARFGGPEAMYGELLFFITCPIAILETESGVNVPIPALKAPDRRIVSRLIARHAAALIGSAQVSGVILLGRYAESVWRSIQEDGPLGLPSAAAHHPAAHVSTEDFHAGLDAALDAVRAQRD